MAKKRMAKAAPKRIDNRPPDGWVTELRELLHIPDEATWQDILDSASQTQRLADRATREYHEGLAASLFDKDWEPVHHWFELSYAEYLTIPRSALQSMPQEWQARFVLCLMELDNTIDWRPANGQYWVQLRAYPKDGREHGRGVLVHDPLGDYERGRRRLPRRRQ